MKAFQCFMLAALVSILAVSTTGCVTRVAGGTKVDAEIINSLTPGLTYQEMIAELGQPVQRLDHKRAIAYTWRTNRGGATTVDGLSGFCRAIFSPPGKIEDNYTTREFDPLHHALCLKFDEQEKLKDWKCFESPALEVLQREMKTWASSDLPITTAQIQSR